MDSAFAGVVRISQNPIGRSERFAMAVKAREFDEGQGFSGYSHEHRAEDGFYRCEFELHLELNDAFDFIRNGLLRFVQVYDPSGTDIVWEGVIWEMELDIDSAKIKNSADNLSDQIKVRYRLPGTGTTLRSGVAEDAVAVRRYGKKEMVLSGGELETSVANQIAAAYLALHKNPKPYPASIDIGEATNRGAALHVYCRGIAETWNFRTYNQTALTGNISASEMVQTVLGQPNLLQNLVAWWDLEETGAADERLDAYALYNLMPVNGPTGGAGKVGNAVYLVRASSQYLVASGASIEELTHPAGAPFAIKAWVYLASKPAGEMWIAGRTTVAWPGTYQYDLRWNNVADRFDFYIRNGPGAADFVSVRANTFGAPGTGTWYLVIGRYDPQTQRIYISVNAGAEDSVVTPRPLYASPTGPFTVGAALTGGVIFAWDGRIDSVAVARRDWMASERAWLYNGGAGRNFDALSYMQYVRSADVQGNGTPVVQVTDMDRRPGDIVRDIARVGDPNNHRFLCYMEENRHFVYSEAARPTYNIV